MSPTSCQTAPPRARFRLGIIAGFFLAGQTSFEKVLWPGASFDGPFGNVAQKLSSPSPIGNDGSKGRNSPLNQPGADTGCARHFRQCSARSDRTRPHPVEIVLAG